MKPNILKNNLFNTGTKFIATSDVKNSALPPSTLGFFSYFKNSDRDYQNVVYAMVSIIRRGKTGQQRIESKEISFPIFADEKMLEKEDYLPVGRSYYLHIEKSPFSHENLMEIEPLDFLGWAYAYVMYLQYVASSFVYPSKRAQWSGDTVDGALLEAKRLSKHFGDDPNATLAVYAREEYRHVLVSAIRKFESKFAKCVCSYKRGAIASILNSAHFLDYTNKEYYEVVDKDLAKNTVSFYQEKYKKINDLVGRNNINIEKKKGL